MADSEIDESDDHDSSGSDEGVEIIVNKKRIRRTKKITKGLAEDSTSKIVIARAQTIQNRAYVTENVFEERSD